MTAATTLGSTLLLWLLAAPALAVEYHGTVVDAETRQPLEGAAVVVMWRKRPYLAMDGPEYLHNVREVLTDAQGRFSINGDPGIDWNPFTYVKWPPYVVVYAPGYKPLARIFMAERGYIRDNDLLDALEKGTAIALPRLAVDAKAGDVADLGSLSIDEDVPFERISDLVRLVNEQRRRLGVTSFYPKRR